MSLLLLSPIGGFQTVTDSLTKLATEEFNVKIRCQATATQIAENGVYYCGGNDDDSLLATPINASFEPADLIIVNADLPYATKSLFVDDNKLQDDVFDNDETFGSNNHNREEQERQVSKIMPKYDWDDQYLFSSGVIAFHWSVNRTIDELSTHNVFLSSKNRIESEQSWEILRRQVTPSSFFSGVPFNFYVNRASKTDPTAAPKGMDSILVLVPCPNLVRNPDLANVSRQNALNVYKEQYSEEYQANVRSAVLERLDVIVSNFSLYILDEVVDTPVSYANQTNVGAGTPFGLSHGLGQLSVMRPTSFRRSTQHRRQQQSNVLFCGASTRPGNGVPLVLIGAKQVAEQAIDQIKKLKIDQTTN